MGIFRVKKDRNNPYVMLNKHFLHDDNLSWKAKGILAYLLSKPDDWQIYEAEIIKHSKDGRESVRSGIKELINNGYIKRTAIRGEKGRFCGYNYDVYEIPNVVLTEVGKPDIGKQDTTKYRYKLNNEKTNTYINLPIDEHRFLKIYNYFYREKYGVDHMKVSIEQLDKIDDFLCEYNDIDEEEFINAVAEHFENLPKTNNGNILAFIEAARRYFY